MATHLAYSSWGWLWLSCLVPVKKWMLQRHTILVLRCLVVMTFKYLQDLIAKKIPTVASWAVAHSSLVLSCLAISLMIEIGIAFWCFSSGSVFLNALNSCYRMKADLPFFVKSWVWVSIFLEGCTYILDDILDCVCNQLFMR